MGTNNIKLNLHRWKSKFEMDQTAQIMRKIVEQQPELLGCSTDFNMQKVRENLPILRQMMEQEGMHLQDELQILLILGRPEFYLLQNRAVDSITGVEISAAAKRLHQATGLTMDVIYKQLANLCYAVKISFTSMELPVVTQNTESDSKNFEEMLLECDGIPAFGYILPVSVYEQEKRELDALYRKKAYQELLEKSSALCGMEIPTAVFYTGYCYLFGLGIEQDVERGVKILKIAARSGEMRAWNALGDYYHSDFCHHVKKDELAYRCYTIFGGEPLNQMQRARINEMRDNCKKYAKNWGTSLVFLIVAAICLSMTIGVGNTASLVVGIVFMVLSVILFGAGIFLQRWFAHIDIMRFTVPATYLLWAIYLFVWIAGLAI